MPVKTTRELYGKSGHKIQELVAINLKTVRAYLLKEDFQRFWNYKSAGWAAKFLDQWCKRTMRSRIDPMKKVDRMLRSHRGLILNWFRAKGQVALGAVEGLNNKAKVTTKKAYGFKSFEVIKLALYHMLGHLPEPEVTHEFSRVKPFFIANKVKFCLYVKCQIFNIYRLDFRHVWEFKNN